MAAQNFRDQNLTGQNFDGQDLSYSLFRGADLTNCSFVGCDLTGINMRDATIEGCDFTDAKMFYCNQKDSQGTANWTNAKVKGVPKWIPMPGSDDVTEPPTHVSVEDRQTLISELMTQSNMRFDLLTPSDQDLSHSFMQDGEKVVLSGTYGDMPNGRNVYVVLDFETSPLQEWSTIVNEHINQETSFDTTSNTFIS